MGHGKSDFNGICHCDLGYEGINCEKKYCIGGCGIGICD
jgi:hypothetical protein